MRSGPPHRYRPEGDDLYEWMAWENFQADNSDRQGGYGRRLTEGEYDPRTNTRYLHNRNVLAKAMGVDKTLLKELEDKLGYDPLELIPEFLTRQEFVDAIGYYQQLSDANLNVLGLASPRTAWSTFDPEAGGKYVDPYDDRVDARVAEFNPQGVTWKKSGEPVSPDFNKQIPTTTKDPKRPRTVAAVWDLNRKVLTVVFRDGTFYNYYEVDWKTWQDFKARLSKGEFILEQLNAHPRGPADVSELAPDLREFLYRAARTAQVQTAARTYKATPKRDYLKTKKVKGARRASQWKRYKP